MKHAILSFFLTLGILAPVILSAQSTPGIMAGQRLGVEDMASDFFRGKQKRYDRSRNERIRLQNQRLEEQIHDLEQELDDCMDSRTRRRYGKRRPAYRYDLQSDYIGERRKEKEYQRLREENEFLRDHRAWLVAELDDCAESHRRDRDRDQYRGRNGGRYDRSDDHTHCSCHQHPSHSKGKHKGKYKKKRDRCDD